MSWNDIWSTIEKISNWAFDTLIKPSGNMPNVILWALIVGLLGYQVSRMVAQNKEAERNGTLK